MSLLCWYVSFHSGDGTPVNVRLRTLTRTQEDTVKVHHVCHFARSSRVFFVCFLFAISLSPAFYCLVHRRSVSLSFYHPECKDINHTSLGKMEKKRRRGERNACRVRIREGGKKRLKSRRVGRTGQQTPGQLRAGVRSLETSLRSSIRLDIFVRRAQSA